MGDRRQVIVKYPNGQSIYFYTHWAGEELPATIAAGLDAGRGRWDDPCYLARIIFSTMTESSPRDEVGYGIATEFQDSDYPEEDIYIELSYGKGGLAGVGKADLSYQVYIEDYLE
jgi:hypothetical protein